LPVTNKQILARLQRIETRLKQTQEGYAPQRPNWRIAMADLDHLQEQLQPPPKPKVPPLGPAVAGGKSVLLEQLTHQTSGLGWPAYDSGWVTGKAVLAVEPMTVYKQSSAAGADAYYSRGVSGLEYWYGHVLRAPATGTRFAKGDRMTTIARISKADGGPHLHWAINAVPLVGHHLLYGRTGHGPDYTFGSPTIGVQLAKELAA
jgi:hypothetical protein